ncbi:TenA family protein [Lyngbya confervoides]|uniref:TenA family protein n=1 Tax=Lyngbya confervoides BDU141951 TaxID=1574623 RepID=A0ABD4T4V2_9CYAN|nr:TenA family protein [Lyngbya confervoides]MCM1983490.1 TenA family protein [Lyngbya confervoides BDU141951]
MGLSASLWRQNLDLAHACLDHPFVQGIADGSLARDCFAYYIGQDAFFLDAFARAYSLAAAKAPCRESFATLHHLASGVLTELELHEGYALSWDIDIHTVQPGSATRQYTDFLGATAWSQPLGVTVVAMAPCMRLYAFLGQSLAQQQPLSSSYHAWVDTYSSPEFEQLAQQIEALVDDYAQDSPLVQSTYRYAMVCEARFFAAAFQHPS